MFERLFAYLKDLPGASTRDPASDRDDPRVAAAALLIRVMDADGERRPAEHAELRYALATLFDLDEPAVMQLVTAGEDAERHAVDVQGFTSVLNRHLDEAGRRAFVEDLFELVFADRDANELEDSIVWRIGQLMGVSPEESDRIRHLVAGRAGDGDA